VDASDWVPPPEVRACPVGIDYDPKRNVIKIAWACFEPAVDPTKKNPDPFSKKKDKKDLDKLKDPGLLPYHIHEVEGPLLGQILPLAVRQDLRRWEGEMAIAHGLRPL
jgi:hypothetical protein